MTGQNPTDESAPIANKAPAVAASPASSTPPVPAADEPVDVSKLSPEEQMARFEKELKENDWGHQPC